MSKRLPRARRDVRQAHEPSLAFDAAIIAVLVAIIVGAALIAST